MPEFDGGYDDGYDDGPKSPGELFSQIMGSMYPEGSARREHPMGSYILTASNEVQSVGIAASAMWCRDFNNDKQRIVGCDTVGRYHVHTEFTGVDLELRPEPMVFETVCNDRFAIPPGKSIKLIYRPYVWLATLCARLRYGRADKSLASKRKRYSTYAAALAGHDQVVAECNALSK